MSNADTAHQPMYGTHSIPAGSTQHFAGIYEGLPTFKSHVVKVFRSYALGSRSVLEAFFSSTAATACIKIGSLKCHGQSGTACCTLQSIVNHSGIYYSIGTSLHLMVRIKDMDFIVLQYRLKVSRYFPFAVRLGCHFDGNSSGCLFR